jgi:endonuclease YncB( thermonuclease family)
MILSRTKQDLASQIIGHGIGLTDTWTGLAYQKEPEDLIGKITWWAGVISQLIISTITFPAAIASFLLEESAQSGGMGAYMLYTSKAWTPLSSYIKVYQNALNGFSSAAANLALVNPIAGGAVIIYMEQAKLSSYAMEEAMLAALRKDARNLSIPNYMQYSASELVNFIEIAESEKASKEITEAQTYGTLAVKSTPTFADIYLDGASTGVQTPETFKMMSAGSHEVAVGKYNTKTKEYDTYATTIEIVAGRKKEITLHIEGGTSDDLINPEDEDEDETPQLPPFIRTTVTVEKMIDGDTFETITGERVRILGMDAPEKGQPIAELATEFMAGKLVDHKVDIKIQTHLPVDTYGRTLAVVTYRDENVAVSSIAAGLAKAYVLKDATYDPTRYLEAENLAKTRQIGIWNPATPGIVWRGY